MHRGLIEIEGAYQTTLRAEYLGEQGDQRPASPNICHSWPDLKQIASANDSALSLDHGCFWTAQTVAYLCLELLDLAHWDDGGNQSKAIAINLAENVAGRKNGRFHTRHLA
jgi:hypothetical protein